MVTTRIIGGATDPDERIRIEWADSLRGHMAERKLTKEQLRLRLKDEHDIEVSRQTVESWLAGKYAPRPHVQAALGTIFQVPARYLFPINNAPAKAVA